MLLRIQENSVIKVRFAEKMTARILEIEELFLDEENEVK